MLPLRDSIPRVHRPVAVLLIITANALVFLYQLGLPPALEEQFIHFWGVIPARLFHSDWSFWHQYPETHLYLFSYMFLHAGWGHFLLNMLFLWIFGDNIEDVMGPWRFLLFYVSCGLAALLLHAYFHPDSTTPILGASGAIAGVMGSYFLLYPHSRVLTLIPIIIIPYFVEIPALVFLGLWFLIQLISGLSTLGSAEGGGIAWWAHAGGFLAGMVLLPVFRNRSRCYFCYNDRGRRIGVSRFDGH
ncbi:rhomboid family intramembrane serine protease [Megalodesulfovibrio gigas]|uniref:Putative rhomboid family protein n=1 Tax=Megalodesulfovibrio gigas (strain ATCC 19364 / DSM 1382 / NCIMB 9332 / VKM B-1759) TaxID=1121448 RepID=T2GDI2_MEGG1|nr:rhomboid family intramembrane serine protease [Megalodesulfovibrio gigas]AGW14625.1 putative rhomboid family protein [Megalodesulfovibrio gigas DSM 1382 = ATCC 19364]